MATSGDQSCHSGALARKAVDIKRLSLPVGEEGTLGPNNGRNS